MKEIINWREAIVFDVEADNLLEEATKIHVLSFKVAGFEEFSIRGCDEEEIRAFFSYCIINGVPLVAHNGIGYDVPLIEKLLGVDLSGLMVIDTLMLSWALNPDRPKHGLASFHSDYGIPKPEIDDWEGLTYDQYRFRCVEDVRINYALWQDVMGRLIDMYENVKYHVDEGHIGGKRTAISEALYIDRYVNNSTIDQYVDRYLQFLMYKGDTGRLREKTKFMADVAHIQAKAEETGKLVGTAKKALEKIMPPVPKYTVTKFPKTPKKKDGTLSSSGKAWNSAIEEIKEFDHLGNAMAIHVGVVEYKEKVKHENGATETVYVKRDTIKRLRSYEEPNANSPVQVKDLLSSKGWVPKTFKFENDKEAIEEWKANGFRGKKPKQRAIPQVTKDGDGGKVLCESVEELAEDSPEIHALAQYGMLKHRMGLFNGFLRDMRDGYLVAGVGGYTNTLRDKHRELVNLPDVKKAYGGDLRGSLIAGEGNILLGSDMSSLEDRIKHCFMLAHDPAYVETMMASDYDPHIDMALTAKLITEQEYEDFKKGISTDHVDKARKMGKACNYASVYGAGADTIARSAGVSKELGKVLHKAYWELNWSVKAIAEDQVSFKDNRGQMWLINPVNGFCYSLRAEKDVFSTLCQGTGSFMFDRWVDNVLEAMYEKWGVKRLSAAFHDEMVICFKDTQQNRENMGVIVKDAIHKVNKEYLLRRELGCDLQYGRDYSKIH